MIDLKFLLHDRTSYESFHVVRNIDLIDDLSTEKASTSTAELQLSDVLRPVLAFNTIRRAFLPMANVVRHVHM